MSFLTPNNNITNISNPQYSHLSTFEYDENGRIIKEIREGEVFFNVIWTNNFAEVYNNIGMIFSDLMRFDEAILSYNKAIKLKPNHEKSYNNLGNLLNSLGKYNEATAAYHQAIKIKSNYARAYSNLLLNLNYKTNFDPDLYLSESKKFRSNCKSIKKDLSFKHQYEKKPKKLRLGFVSADFGNHPGGYFSLSTLRELRKKNFEIVAYSTKDRSDDLSSSFRSLFSKWNSIEKKK